MTQVISEMHQSYRSIVELEAEVENFLGQFLPLEETEMTPEIKDMDDLRYHLDAALVLMKEYMGGE